MENSELERIADEKRERALELNIDEKASEIVYGLGKEKNIERLSKDIHSKSEDYWTHETRWHYENGMKISIWEYYSSKENNGRYDSRTVEIYLDVIGRFLKFIPVKTKSIVYSHQVMITTSFKEGKKEKHGFHILGCFRDETKWLGILEELHEKALTAGLEKSINKIEKESVERNKELKERFGV